MYPSHWVACYFHQIIFADCSEILRTVGGAVTGTQRILSDFYCLYNPFLSRQLRLFHGNFPKPHGILWDVYKKRDFFFQLLNIEGDINFIPLETIIEGVCRDKLSGHVIRTVKVNEHLISTTYVVTYTPLLS